MARWRGGGGSNEDPEPRYRAERDPDGPTRAQLRAEREPEPEEREPMGTARLCGRASGPTGEEWAYEVRRGNGPVSYVYVEREGSVLSLRYSWDHHRYAWPVSAMTPEGAMRWFGFEVRS